MIPPRRHASVDLHGFDDGFGSGFRVFFSTLLQLTPALITLPIIIWAVTTSHARHDFKASTTFTQINELPMSSNSIPALETTLNSLAAKVDAAEPHSWDRARLFYQFDVTRAKLKYERAKAAIEATAAAEETAAAAEE